MEATKRDTTDDVRGVTDSAKVRRALQAISDETRQRHPWLAHQDAIGLALFAASASTIVVNAWAFAMGWTPVWLTVVMAAFAMSILHELEHDLIHRLYLKSRPRLYHALMLGVWLFRPSTISPWVRRDWHLHHHRVSGTRTDVEERAITNGEPWGVRRLLMTADGVLAIVLRPSAMRDMLVGYAEAQKAPDKRAYRRILWRNRLSYAPLGNLHFALWHTFLFVHAQHLVCNLLGAADPTPAWLQAAVPTLDFLVVVWLGPNVLRTFCLHFVSSNMHYYGDIEPRNVVQQTQVWTSPWSWPVQLFCFNFGGTHAIHHFVVQEPFYLRQWIAPRAYPVMRAYGVRFNDFGSFLRANRWGAWAPGSHRGHDAARDERSAARGLGKIVPLAKVDTRLS